MFRQALIFAFVLLCGAEAQAQGRAANTALCERAPELSEATPVQGTTVQSEDHFHASCARSALSGDRVYRFEVPRRARVSLRVEADYDAALYVRRACDDEVTEVACNDDSSDTRHAALDLTLDAGTWFVFVDGFDLEAAGRFTLSMSMDPIAPSVEVLGEVPGRTLRGIAGTRVEAVNRAGRVIADGTIDARGRFTLRVPGEQLVRVRARIRGVEISTELFDAAQRRAITLGGASVRRAPAGSVPSA